MSHVLVLGKVWWRLGQHHVEGLREDPYHWTELPSLNKDYYYYYYVKYIAWPSPHFSKRYRARYSVYRSAVLMATALAPRFFEK